MDNPNPAPNTEILIFMDQYLLLPSQQKDDYPTCSYQNASKTLTII